MENGSNSSSIKLEGMTPQPHPLPRQAGGLKAAYYIIGNGFFELVAFIMLIKRLDWHLVYNYSKDDEFSNIVVEKVLHILYIVALVVVPIISNAYLGKFQTLLLGSVTSFLGMGILILTASIPQLRCVREFDSNCVQPQIWQLGILFAGLGLVTIGASATPCNIAIGLDQFDSTTEKGKKEIERFINWWYFYFILAFILANVILVYVLNEQLLIQGTTFFVLAFTIGMTCVGFSIIILLLGRHSCIWLKPQGRSIIVDIAMVITAAYHKYRPSLELACEHSLYDPQVDETRPSRSKLPRTDRFKYLDKAALIIDQSELSPEGVPKNGWRLCTVQQVEQLKCLLGILPVWFSTIVCYFSNKTTTTWMQASLMDKSIGHLKITEHLVILTPNITILIWIIIYQQIYIHQAHKTKKGEAKLPVQQRIKIGIVLSILGMLVAGIVEKERRDLALRNGSSVSPMSIAFLLPQLVLWGLAKAFAEIALIEFLTVKIPESMRSFVGVIFFLGEPFSIYLDSLLAIVVNSILKRIEGQDVDGIYYQLNNASLEYYYYIVATFGVFNLIYFNLYASRYVGQNIEGQEREQQLENSTASHSRMLHKCEWKDEENGL